MPLMSGLLDPATQMPRNRLFWVVLGGLALAQIVALWLLCSHQVRLAEARQTEIHVQQLALADCLQYIPGATIATCNSRIGRDSILQARDDSAAAAATRSMGAGAASPAPAPAARGGTFPVNYSR